MRAHCAGCAACSRTLEAAREVATAVPGRRHPKQATGRSAGISLSPAPSWARLLLFGIPWTVAVIGWIIAIGFIAYSHGQADRLRTTRQSQTATIASLQRQVAQEGTVQDYVSTPNIKIMPLHSPLLTRWKASASLVFSAQYATALLVARGLPLLPKSRAYTIWVRGDGGPYIRVGTLTLSGVRHNGVAVVVGPKAFEHFTTVVLSVEHSPATQQPSASIVGTAPISPTATQ